MRKNIFSRMTGTISVYEAALPVPCYSYRSASMGLSSEALYAG
jgi:hypothetical protein